MWVRTLSLINVSVLAALAADLPVREVILYKHGVAYFERSGELKPGETARLDFKASDMNDVLKSLTIHDRSGGKVGGVRYDASEPLEKRLENFPFAIGEETSLAAFLDRVKGARLELKLGSETGRRSDRQRACDQVQRQGQERRARNSGPAARHG
jgi:hypothetical protein